MPRQKAPEVGFGIVPTGRYMGDVSGSVPNGVGPVIAGDFFIDRSTTPAVWVVQTGAALSSNATIYGVFSGSGSTAATTGNSSLFTGTGVVIAGTTTPSTPVAVSTAGTSGFGLVARSSIAAPNVQWEHVELFGISSLFTAHAVVIAGSTDVSTPTAVPATTVLGEALVYRTTTGNGLAWEVPNSTYYTGQTVFLVGSTAASTPLAITATTVLGAAPVYRTTTGQGLAYEIPNSTFFSGQGVLLMGTTVASTPVAGASTAAAGDQLVFRTSVAGGWNPEAVSAGAITPGLVHVIQTTSQTVANATETALSFQTVNLNVGSAYSTTAPTRLTIPSSWNGLRARLDGTASWAGSATGRRLLFIRKNGSGYTAQRDATPGATVDCCVGTYNFITCATSDYYELFVYQTSGGDLGLQLNANLVGGVNFGITLEGNNA